MRHLILDSLLQRDLVAKDYHCDVAAPTSTPSSRGKQVKTDRIDAAQLVQFYANNLLTLVTIIPESDPTRLICSNPASQ